MPIEVLDANGDPQTVATIDDLILVTGQATPTPAADTLGDRLKTIREALVAPTPEGEGHIGATGSHTAVVSATSLIVRPNNSTSYSAGDLVANDTNPALVAALQFNVARISGGSGAIVGAHLQKSTNDIGNAAFRIHLFTITPTFTSAGDNSLFTAVVVAKNKIYLGYVDIPAMVAFSDCALGSGAPDNSRGAIAFVAAVQTIYGIVEARGGYAGHALEEFQVSLAVIQD